MVWLENGSSKNVAHVSSKRYSEQHFPSLPLWNNMPAAWTDALLLYIVQRGFISLNRCILLLSFQLGHIWEWHRALRMNNRPHAHYANEMFACTGKEWPFWLRLKREMLHLASIPASVLMNADYSKIYCWLKSIVKIQTEISWSWNMQFDTPFLKKKSYHQLLYIICYQVVQQHVCSVSMFSNKQLISLA